MEEKNWWKKLSIFQIVSIILIATLVVVIIVQIGLMINLKNKIDDTKDKNDQITQSVVYYNIYQNEEIENEKIINLIK